ncbi:MAG: prolipoprotein diacylglyceryl transferase [Negativicutes bacterium]|nr:prolipoprotein diacylglyceryl transferase [Negativicutes bacterium]
MCKVAFDIGPFHFYWYGTIIAVAALVAFVVIWWQSRLFRDPVIPLVDMMLYGMPTGIICSRGYYVITNWELYRDNPWESLYIWQGGLSVYGALIGLVVVLLIYTRTHRLSFWHWADLCAPGLAIGQAIGQWANLINQESFGYPTLSAWGVYIDYAVRPAGFEQFDFFQPIFLPESVWNLLLFFVVLTCIYGHRKRNWLQSGSMFLLYLLLFSIGHFYLAGLRLDLEAGAVFLTQLMSSAIIAVTFMIFVRRNRYFPGRKEKGEH